MDENYRKHIKQVLREEGIDYCRSYNNYEMDDWQSFMQEVEDKQQENNPERNTMFKMTMEKLSEEAKEVTSLIFNMPFELCEFVCTKDKQKLNDRRWLTMDDIRQYLRYHNWTHNSINRVFRELKKIVKSF